MIRCILTLQSYTEFVTNVLDVESRKAEAAVNDMIDILKVNSGITITQDSSMTLDEEEEEEEGDHSEGGSPAYDCL